MQSKRDLEAEMKRLKLELKQTMNMYSNACKEAITAKQQVMLFFSFEQISLKSIVGGYYVRQYVIFEHSVPQN